MAVLVAGVSPRALYVLQCREWRCKCNSALRVQLPDDTPLAAPASHDSGDDDVHYNNDAAAATTTLCGAEDGYARVRAIDLRNNFVGPRGVRPLLDVVAHCHALHTLRLCGQQLDVAAIEALCAAVRQHRALALLDVSHNPLTIAAGALLLELARDNTRLEHVVLTHTPLEHTTLALALDAQLQLNRDVHALATTAVTTSRHDAHNHNDDDNNNADDDTTAASRSCVGGGGVVAVVTTGDEAERRLRRRAAAEAAAARRVAPYATPLAAHDVVHDAVRHAHAHRVSPLLFDDNPLPQLARACMDARQHYYDVQFAPHLPPPSSSSSSSSSRSRTGSDDEVVDTAAAAGSVASDEAHAVLRRVYKVTHWRRACNIYPHAQLVPSCATGAASTLQRSAARTHPGLAWLHTCVAAAADAASSCAHAWLQQLVLAPDVRALQHSKNNDNDNDDGNDNDDDLVRRVGVYAVRLHVDGAWRYVVVDDYLPVTRTGDVAFAHAAVSNDAAQRRYYLWPCLVEKAIAKLYGGYHAIDDHFHDDDSNDDDDNDHGERASAATRLCAHVLACLTAGHVVTRTLHSAHFDAAACWTAMTTLLPLPLCSEHAGDDEQQEQLQQQQQQQQQQEEEGDEASARASRACVRPRSGVAVAMSRGRGAVRRMAALCGLRARHAYVVRAAAACNGVHIVQLCDPGDSSNCTQRNDDDGVRRASTRSAASTWWHETHVALARDSTATTTTTHTAHTMDAALRRRGALHYADFLSSFATLCLCRALTLRYEQRVHGAWTAATAGGRASCATWHHNPHYTLRLRERGCVCVQLRLPDPHVTPRTVDAMALHIIEATAYPLLAQRPARAQQQQDDNNDNSSFYFFSKYVTGDALLFEGVLEAGRTYWLVPSTHTAQRHSRFTLCVASASCAFVLDRDPQPLAAHWTLHELDVDACDSYSRGVAGDVHAQLVLQAQCGADDGGGGGARAGVVAVMPTVHLRATVTAYHDDDDNDDDEQQQGDDVTTRPCHVLDDHDDDDDHVPRLSLTCTRRTTATSRGEGRVVDDADVVVARSAPSRRVCDGSDDRHDAAAAPLVAAHLTITPAASPAADTQRDTRHDDGCYRVMCCVDHATSPRQRPRQQQQQQQLQRRVRRVHFSVWCARPHATASSPSLRVSAVPPWPVRRVCVAWTAPHGSGTYYEAAPHNPQVELYPARAQRTYVLTVTLRSVEAAAATTDATTMTLPALSFAVINNRGRQGEGWLGTLPSPSSAAASTTATRDNDDEDNGCAARHDTAHRRPGRVPSPPSLLLRSAYVQAGSRVDDDDEEEDVAALQRPLRVRCIVTLTQRDASDSLLIVPCLQPTGSVGVADVTVASCDDDFDVRVVSTPHSTQRGVAS